MPTVALGLGRRWWRATNSMRQTLNRVEPELLLRFPRLPAVQAGFISTGINDRANGSGTREMSQPNRAKRRRLRRYPTPTLPPEGYMWLYEKLVPAKQVEAAYRLRMAGYDALPKKWRDIAKETGFVPSIS